MIQVALVGAGSFAKTHLRAYARNRKAKVKWICDPQIDRAEAYANDFSIPCVTADFQDVLADGEVDLVDIVAPNYLHKPLTIAALEAGKAVLCEKPMALNAQESQEMVDASVRTKRPLFVKYHQRFDPVHQRVKAMLENGEFPKPVMALATLYGNHLPSILDPRHWRGNPKLCGGGCLFSSGSHVLDLLHFFFGDLAAITAINRQLVANNPEKADDNATVIMEFESGVLVTFVGCWTTSSWTWAKEIHAVERSLKITDVNGTNRLELVEKGAPKILMEQPNWTLTSNFAAIDHFIDCLTEGVEPLYTLEDVVRSMRTLDLAYRSSKEGRRIVVDQDGSYDARRLA